MRLLKLHEEIVSPSRRIFPELRYDCKSLVQWSANMITRTLKGRSKGRIE